MRRATGLAWPAFALMCASVCLLGSCAYYNIFWTAEREYAAATAGNAFAEFSDPYAQPKPTGENLKNIDSCLKRCGKILLLYPTSRWVDDSLVLMGNCFVLKGEYANALRKYEELLKFYPQSEFADEARYMKAYTHVIEGSEDEALALLESQAGQMVGKQWQERSVFLQARIYEARGDCERVITLLQDYLSKFAGGPRGHRASLALGHCLIKAGRQSEAVSVLTPLVTRQDEAGAVAAVRLSRAYRELGQPDEAIDVLDGLYKSTTVDSLRARAQIEKALTLDGAGRPQEAIEVLSPTDSLGKVVLGQEASYRLGLIYEKSLGDFDKATAAYDAVTKGTSDFSKAAQKRGAALKAVNTYTQALVDSTATTESLARSRFALAEAYLLDLELPTLAEEQYRVLSDSLPANEFTARSMLVLGGLLEGRGDSTATAYYRAVIDSFPNTIQANIARARLDLPLVDVVTEPAETVFVGPPAPDVVDSVAVDSSLADSLSTAPSRILMGPELVPEDTLRVERPPVRTRPEEPAERSTGGPSWGEPVRPRGSGDADSTRGPWGGAWPRTRTPGSPADTSGSPADSTFAPQSGGSR